MSLRTTRVNIFPVSLHGMLCFCVLFCFVLCCVVFCCVLCCVVLSTTILTITCGDNQNVGVVNVIENDSCQYFSCILVLCVVCFMLYVCCMLCVCGVCVRVRVCLWVVCCCVVCCVEYCAFVVLIVASAFLVLFFENSQLLATKMHMEKASNLKCNNIVSLFFLPLHSFPPPN
jgi:hypothetical protein